MVITQWVSGQFCWPPEAVCGMRHSSSPLHKTNRETSAHFLLVATINKCMIRVEKENKIWYDICVFLLQYSKKSHIYQHLHKDSWMNDWLNENVNECMHEWMYEWMNVRMNECLNEWRIELTVSLITRVTKPTIFFTITLIWWWNTAIIITLKLIIPAGYAT